MRTIATTTLSAMTATLLLATAPAEAACTRLAFSVNDYGKDGPTKDARKLLDSYIAKWTAERGIKAYRTGPKSVSCELFLNLIVFDEHTCKAEATVCWDGAPVPGQSAGQNAGQSPSGATAAPTVAKPAAPPKRPPPTKPTAATSGAATVPVAATPAKPTAANPDGQNSIYITPSPRPATPVAAPSTAAPVRTETGTIPPDRPSGSAAAAAADTDAALQAAQRAAAAAERAAAAAERAAAAASAAEKATAR